MEFTSIMMKDNVGEQKPRKVAIFNLKYDVEDAVLSHTINWAEEFLFHFDEVEVYSTHVGQYHKNLRIQVNELGGGSTRKRIIALAKLASKALQIIHAKGNFVVFYHMNEKAAALLSPIFYFFGIKQALWYAHSEKTMRLKIATLFCQTIFSPTVESFPISSSKLFCYGHGINISKFRNTILFLERSPTNILFLGRVTPIKNVELLINAVNDCKNVQHVNLEIDLVGPVYDSNYLEKLMKFANSKEVKLNYLGPVSPAQVPHLLNEYRYVYVGNPNTIDKVGVEALICGCAVITEVHTMYMHLGLYTLYRTPTESKTPKPLSEQLMQLLGNNPEDITEIKELSKAATSKNNLKTLVSQICDKILNDV